ncbi:MAG TPA: FtsW/RodA/SpoVE family cell cycle protein [Candidatus Humimicrobiaceae bacterium]|nr:FtsW/RodA/SpoVE family cell cycle protein [Candidatus Humimicrobiaceae bacterium]
MRILAKLITKDPVFSLSVLTLVLISMLVLNSISPSIFPVYYFYVILSFFVFIFFVSVDYKILATFYWHFYVLSIILLILPLIIGQITRGAIRWIPLGPITIQTSEIVRPFLLIFFSVYATSEEIRIKKLFKLVVLTLIPVSLILIQPSLGVSIITALGIIGIVLTSKMNKKLLLSILVLIPLIVPLFWFMLAPYQRDRISGFINPQIDSLGAGYNSIQSTISVGSGKIFGRGLGKGIQTQLAFLPEKHTDFIFAAIAEELGLVGAGIVLICLFNILFRITKYIEISSNPKRAYLIGVLFVITAETVIHLGMNMGLLPITGLPLPLVSAGGSALLSTSISLAIAVGKRQSS